MKHRLFIVTPYTDSVKIYHLCFVSALSVLTSCQIKQFADMIIERFFIY